MFDFFEFYTPKKGHKNFIQFLGSSEEEVSDSTTKIFFCFRKKKIWKRRKKRNGTKMAPLPNKTLFITLSRTCPDIDWGFNLIEDDIPRIGQSIVIQNVRFPYIFCYIFIYNWMI